MSDTHPVIDRAFEKGCFKLMFALQFATRKRTNNH